jgi:hypothetical protein
VKKLTLENVLNFTGKSYLTTLDWTILWGKILCCFINGRFTVVKIMGGWAGGCVDVKAFFE